MSRWGRLLNEALLFCMGQGICDHGPPFYSSLYGNPDHGEKYAKLNKEKQQKGALESGICYTWEVRLTGEGQGNLSSRSVRTARRFDYIQIIYSKTKHFTCKRRFLSQLLQDVLAPEFNRWTLYSWEVIFKTNRKRRER